MKDYYFLNEVEALTGIPEATLRTRLNRSELKGLKVPIKEGGKRLVWALSPIAVEALKNEKSSGVGTGNDYEKAFKRWQDEQSSGYRRATPLDKKTIDRNGYGLVAFWDYLDGVKPCQANQVEPRRLALAKPKTLERFTLENIMLAIAAVPKANPSVRENIYKSAMSFYGSLVYGGLRSELDLLKFKTFKPAANKRPRRTFVRNDQQFEELLAANQAWHNGRTKYDRLLTDVLLKFLFFSALRNSELCSVQLYDVDFNDETIFIEFGKNGKSRTVGLHPQLKEALQSYLKKRPVSSHKNLLLQANGTPLNKRVVSERVGDIGKRIGLDLTPHGLRRTLITKLLKDGNPAVLVQKVAGHERLSTTELYNMTSAEDALDLLRKRKSVNAPKTEVRKAYKVEF